MKDRLVAGALRLVAEHMLHAVPLVDVVGNLAGVVQILTDDEVLAAAGQTEPIVAALLRHESVDGTPLGRQCLRGGIIVVEANDREIGVAVAAHGDGKQAMAVVALPHAGLHVVAVAATGILTEIAVGAVDDGATAIFLVLHFGELRGGSTLQSCARAC